MVKGKEFQDWQQCAKCGDVINWKADCYYAYSNGDYQDPVICLSCIEKIPGRKLEYE